MEIGNEIGQKIRSAIKAKLVDLGAYVDDELPDYIMVMVANKKTHAQMSEDLSLFLGPNTAKFTTWLRGLLEKLQSITTDSAVNAAEKQSQAAVIDASMLSPSTAPQSKIIGDSEKKSTGGEQSVVAVASKPAAEEAERDAGGKEGKAKGVSQKCHGGEGGKQGTTTEEEPVIRIRLEHNEFEEEQTNDGKGSSRSASKPVKPTLQRRHTEDASKRQHEEYIPEKYHPSAPAIKPERAETRDDERRIISSAALKQSHVRPSDDRDAPGEGGLRMVAAAPPRKRAASTLGSLVGAVLSHADDDDEYDPCRPAIGNVASIVKVTERKSSVPLSMQASKSLLLRAMQQAEQSVADIKQRSAAAAAAGAASLKPVFQSDDRRPRASIHRRLGPLGQPAVLPPHGHQGRAARADLDLEETRLISMSKRIKMAAGVFVPREMKVERSEEAEESFNDRFSDLDEEDTRLVQCTVLNANAASLPACSRAQESDGQRSAVPSDSPRGDSSELENGEERDEGGEEEEDAEEEAALREILIQQKKQKTRPATNNPKFVVTLDTVYQRPLAAGESGYHDDDELHVSFVDDDLALSTGSTSPPPAPNLPRNVVRVKPQFVQQQQMRAAETLQAPGFDDESGQFKLPPQGAKKSSERCRFWPVCKNGDACSFHHPNTTCKMFPQCRFGDKCLYIHPTCRFDALCRKSGCPYTHVSLRATNPAPAPPAYVPQAPRAPHHAALATGGANPAAMCRFYPNCADMACAYTHPKPCRYGLSCTNKAACTYGHPQLPTKSQLKWTPAQQ